MSSELAVIDCGEGAEIDKLARAVYANQEPAFQIDGVTDYEELELVFAALAVASPVDVTRRDLFDHVATTLLQDHPTSPKPQYAHIDGTFHGLAVHQNVYGLTPVTMATAPRWSRELNKNKQPVGVVMSMPGVHNIRTGVAPPGRLTIFSQGNGRKESRHDMFPGLLPTLHYFDRSQSLSARFYTRYCTINPRSVRFIPRSILHNPDMQETALQTFKALQGQDV